MSLVFNMVGGGGGGELLPTDAILRVQAPAGSTVTISKGAVSKSDLGHENAADPTVYDYYFIIHQSQFDSTPWNVTATLGSQIATTTVVVNAADEYDVNLSYRIDLYINGDQCVSVTGGWSKVVSNGTLNFGADEMDYKSGNDSTERYVATENAIDLTTFSTVYFSAKCNSSSAKNVGVASTRGGAWVASQAITRGTTYTVYAVDVSNLTGLYYVEFSNASSPTATFVNLVYAE